jgi:hypothetical protein
MFNFLFASAKVALFFGITKGLMKKVQLFNLCLHLEV